VNDWNAIRLITGYIAHALLAGYWIWGIANTGPQLRKSSRNRALVAQVTGLRSAGIVLTALLVGVIHYWATEPWQVVAALVLAGAVGVPLRTRYRKLVTAPRHRLTLSVRARDFERRHGLLPHRSGPDRQVIRPGTWTPHHVHHSRADEPDVSLVVRRRGA
jgi:hypothetical protein